MCIFVFSTQIMESVGVKKNHFHWYLILISFVILLMPLPLAGQWSNITIEKVCRNKALAKYFQQSYRNISQNLDSACFYGERGLALAIRVDNAPATCLGYILLSRTYLLTPDYTKALEYMDIATTMNNKTDVPELDAYIRYVKAVKNMMLGKQQEAIEETTESVRIYERLRDTAGMVSLYKFIGKLFLQSRDTINLMKAKRSFFRALELQIRQKDWERLGSIYGIIGFAYIEENNLDSANIYFLKAIQYDIRYNKHIWLATDYMRLGDIKMIRGQFDSAEYYMKLAGKYFSHPNDQALQLISLGKVKKMRKEYPEAMNLFLQAYDLTTKNNLQPALLSVINELVATAEVKGDPVTALKYMKEYAQLKDTLSKTEKMPTISLLDIQRQHDLKTRQMEMDKEKINLASHRKNAYIAILAIISILLILISLVIIYFLRLRQRAISLEKAELDNTLEFKNRELALQVINLMKRNEFIIDASRRLIEIKSEQKPEDMKTEVIKIAKSLQDQTDKEIWEEFELRFKQVHSGFYERLLEKFPELTPNELKMCGLLRLNLTTKEMSELTGQRRETIEMARFRLRKHLGLNDPQINLVNFLGKI